MYFMISGYELKFKWYRLNKEWVKMCFNTQKNRSDTDFYVNEKGLCPENIFLKLEKEINF